MLNGIILGIIAMLCYGVQEIFLKKILPRLGTYTTTLYRELVIVILIVLYAALSGEPFVFTLEILGWMILLGILGTCAVLSFFAAIKIGKVSIVSPIAHASTVITVLLAAIFYHEQLTHFQGFAVLLIILGTIIASFRWKDLKNLKLHEVTKGVPFAVITFFLWGVVFFLMKIPIKLSGILVPSILLDGFIFLILASAVPWKGLRKPTKKEIWLIILVGFLSAIGTLTFNYAYTLELISLIAPIVYSSPFITVILAHIYLKEVMEMHQYVGVIGIIVGVVLLAL